MQKLMGRSLALGAALLCTLPLAAGAVIIGPCDDCHTSDDPAAGPEGIQLRMDCIGCHAQGLGEKIVTLAGGTQVPQVYHIDVTGDLAAGNFAYITGEKGWGAAGSRKGHDVRDFGLLDDTLTRPPGFIHSDRELYFQAENLTCAGVNGCHGIRNQLAAGDPVQIPKVGFAAIIGAHHGNEEGVLDLANTVGSSYRFLMGVQGLENPDPTAPWQNVSAASHNEYLGRSGRIAGMDNPDDCFKCHVNSTMATTTSYITTPYNTISSFCRSCHSGMHASAEPGTRAFLRHPSDFVIRNEGEYAAYETYSITAPVARKTVLDVPSSSVNPGEDMVMCLSCHMAHASPYDSMLRFDYTKMVAGNAGDAAGTGCLACHTTKGR